MISNNTISSNNQIGIRMNGCSKNTIMNNKVLANYKGISIFNSRDNEIICNTFQNNCYGIDLLLSKNNRIYCNNFIDNRRHVVSANSENVWDCGFRGNYWNDYTGVDPDNDGVGNTPYIIDEKNKDLFPLMTPSTSTLFYITIFSRFGNATGSGWYLKDSVAAVTIDKTVIDHGNGTRRVFKGWFENDSLLSSEQSFSFTVDKSRAITAAWDTMYEVKVLSERGTVNGSGWYKAGDIAMISIAPSHIEEFFYVHVFDGWTSTGTKISASPEYSFRVDKPVSLTASWRTEYNIKNVTLILGVFIEVAALAWVVRTVVCLLKKVRKAENCAVFLYIIALKEFLRAGSLTVNAGIAR